MGSNKTKDNLIRLIRYLLCFFAAFAAVMAVYRMIGFAPFGDRSLAHEDGYYQYLDFFAYYRDVLLGKQKVTYALSNGLGQASLPILMYYLASPWNLIILFFDKTQLHSFFDIVAALKIATSFVTCSYYLDERFERKISLLLNLALSTSYAFMHYNISQAQCPMWLDGVYMLPLIALGVYKVVKERKIRFLAVSFCLSVLLNWYTAGISLIYSFLFFALELSINRQETEGSGQKTSGLGAVVRYLYALGTGGFLSMFIILPTLAIMRQTTRTQLDLNAIKNELFGDVFTAFEMYALGGIGERGILAFYSGGLILVGAVCFLCSHNVKLRVKIAGGITLAACIMACYWKPLFWVFSLFQSADSYFYRFAYICTFTLLFLTAYYFAYEKEAKWKYVIGVIAFYLLCVLKKWLLEKNTSVRYTFITIVLQIAVTALVYLYVKNRTRPAWKNGLILAAVLVITAGELGYHATLVMRKYLSIDQVPVFEAYQEGQEALISDVKGQDASYYRITQASTRPGVIDLHASHDEAMAFGFWGVGNYTSTPDADLIQFYNKIGYNAYLDRIVQKSMSNLPIDSLLGVKYILSPYNYEELTLRSDITPQNGKSVYENPYYMPMAFKTEIEDGFSSDEHNVYHYINQLYSYVTGTERPVFIETGYSETGEENTRTYTITIPEGNYALYGSIPWTWYGSNWNTNAELDLNGRLSVRYACDASMKCFYVPISKCDTGAYVTVNSKDYTALGNPEFYLVDLDYLGEVSALARENVPENLIVTDTKLTGQIEAAQGESLFVSIPYADGWQIKINGKKVKPEFVENCLMVIPLEAGINDVSMTYHIAYLIPGCVLSLIALLLLIFDRKVIAAIIRTITGITRSFLSYFC